MYEVTIKEIHDIYFEMTGHHCSVDQADEILELYRRRFNTLEEAIEWYAKVQGDFDE